MKIRLESISAGGATELSPALQRRVSVAQEFESRRDDICRAYGTRAYIRSYPALKRWAMICRPAGGTVALVVTSQFPSRNANQDSVAFVASTPALA